eukprot:483807_1
MATNLLTDLIAIFEIDNKKEDVIENIKDYEMEYRILGKSGLKVSAFSFGFWCTFGTDIDDVIKCANMLNYCIDHGINLFDNAEQYGSTINEAEIIMGKALKLLTNKFPTKWRRSNYIICTKIFFGGNGVNELGLSYKHLFEGINGSINRLQLEYIDIILLHRPDPLTPSIRIAEIMNNIIMNDNKVLYWGTSQWSAALYTEIYYICEINNFIKPIMDQCQYNMFERNKIENEFLRLFKSPYNIGTMTYSPLNTGILTGKYNKNIPNNSRLAMKNYKFLQKK